MNDEAEKRPVVVVPARLGSQRVRLKSLRLLNDEPLISYIIKSLKGTKCLTDIYINSDSDYFKPIAERFGVKFYKRAAELATSSSMIDDYIYDFIVNRNVKYLAVVNPTSPFITSKELDRAWLQFLESGADTQLCCERIQTHCFYKGKAVNFSTSGQHPRSQDLEPVLALNFAITIWNAEKFVEQYQRLGHGVYTGKLGYFETEGNANIDIDYEEDFDFAEFVVRYLKSEGQQKAEYDPIVRELIDGGLDTRN